LRTISFRIVIMSRPGILIDAARHKVL